MSNSTKSDISDVVEQLRLSNDELRTTNRLLATLATQGLQKRDATALLAALGLAPKQIATVLHTTPNAIRVALHKARKAGRPDVPIESTLNRTADVQE